MLAQRIEELFIANGYQKYKMTKFEEYDLYASHRDFLETSQIITFNDLDGSLLALKPDITLSIVKNASKPQKVYYNETVYRPRDHHYREIPQLGVEWLGEMDAYTEAETIALACSCLSAIEPSYVLRINDIGLLHAIFDKENLSHGMQKEILDALSAKNVDALEEMAKKQVISQESADRWIALLHIDAPLKKALEEMEPYFKEEAYSDSLRQLRQLSNLLEILDENLNVYFDFSLVNSLDYYTGTIFQGMVETIPFPILSGGRYDRLVSKMGKPMQAIGFAVYMDVVENNLRISEEPDSKRTLILYDSSDSLRDVAKLICTGRKNGLPLDALSKNGFDDKLTDAYQEVVSYKEYIKR